MLDALLQTGRVRGKWLRDRARAWTDAVRRNHGLEHATVTILLARQGPTRLVGRAAGDGFFIIGEVDERLLDDCAHEALRRMHRGEASLAVSPLCGTNIAVTAALTTAAVMASLARNGGGAGFRDRFGNAFSLAMMAAVIAQPVGRLVQQHITTRGDLTHIEIVETRTLFPGVRKIYTRDTRRGLPGS